MAKTRRDEAQSARFAVAQEALRQAAMQRTMDKDLPITGDCDFKRERAAKRRAAKRA